VGLLLRAVEIKSRHQWRWVLIDSESDEADPTVGPQGARPQGRTHPRAGLGPWTQLLDRGRRLQILYLLGQREQFPSEVDTLLDQVRGLPDQPGPDESV
jgi:hypothetical protein